jgi:hypothetical protein
MVEKGLEPFLCLTSRFSQYYVHYDTSTVGLERAIYLYGCIPVYYGGLAMLLALTFIVADQFLQVVEGDARRDVEATVIQCTDLVMLDCVS